MQLELAASRDWDYENQWHTNNNAIDLNPIAPQQLPGGVVLVAVVVLVSTLLSTYSYTFKNAYLHSSLNDEKAGVTLLQRSKAVNYKSRKEIFCINLSVRNDNG